MGGKIRERTRMSRGERRGNRGGLGWETEEREKGRSSAPDARSVGWFVRGVVRAISERREIRRFLTLSSRLTPPPPPSPLLALLVVAVAVVVLAYERSRRDHENNEEVRYEKRTRRLNVKRLAGRNPLATATVLQRTRVLPRRRKRAGGGRRRRS